MTPFTNEHMVFKKRVVRGEPRKVAFFYGVEILIKFPLIVGKIMEFREKLLTESHFSIVAYEMGGWVGLCSIDCLLCT